MRAKLVENNNFERNVHPKEALGIGGISLGKARHEAKIKSEQDWNTYLENLLVGKRVNGIFKHIYTNTDDGMEFDGDDKWENQTIDVESIITSDNPWDDYYIQVNTTDRRGLALPINDKKIFIEGPIKENQNFERGINNPSDLGLGKWKEGEDTIVPIYDFEKNGGVLTKGREIWRWAGLDEYFEGYYLDYDPEQRVHLMYNDRFKSVPIPPGSGVKVKTKVLYQ